MPESKAEKMERFLKDYELPEYDANLLCDSMELADYFEEAVKVSKNSKTCANFIITEVMRVLKDQNITIESFMITPAHLGKIISLIDNGTISSKIAKEVFEIKLNDERDPEVIVKEKEWFK